MKKSRLMCIFLAVMMLSTSVFAATGSNVIKIDGVGVGTKLTVNVSYPTDHSGRGTIYVIPADVDDTAIEEVRAGNFGQAVYVGESTDPDPTNVTFIPSYSFVMPEDADSGVYLVVTDGMGDMTAATRSRKFYYNEETSVVDEKLEDINDEITKDTLEAGINSAWYIDTTNSAWTDNASRVISIMNELKGDGFESAAEVEELFIIACHFASPASYTDADFLADIAYNNEGILGVDKTDVEYIANPEYVISKFRTLLIANPVSTKAEIVNLFRTACALACISTTIRTTGIEDLKKYQDIFQLDYEGDFKTTNPTEIAKSFEGTEFTTVAQVRQTFKDAVAFFVGSKKDPVINNGGSGSAGGGNAGGGGGGATAGPPNVDRDEDETGTAVDKLPVNADTFSDVPKSHWAYSYIEFVYDSSIMSGDPNGKFRPDDKITREEWAKVVLNALGINTTETAACDFNDVNETDWFYPFVSRAFELRVVNGITEETFGAGRNVSRQDAVVMLNRALSLIKEVNAGENSTDFVDAYSIADYAKDAVTLFASLGIINGYEDGSFAPGGNITRAECAKIVKTLFDAIEM